MSNFDGNWEIKGNSLHGTNFVSDYQNSVSGIPFKFPMRIKHGPDEVVVNLSATDKTTHFEIDDTYGVNPDQRTYTATVHKVARGKQEYLIGIIGRTKATQHAGEPEGGTGTDADTVAFTAVKTGPPDQV
jgi:hypothetical protein